jgi:succinate dehydrogenase / fumarate reductase membrane anchor subunit
MTATTREERRVPAPRNFEAYAWLFMRYSAIVLIPLVWIHVALQDVLVGVHAIDLDYVALRWATLGWRVYDVALLAFAFGHGMNGMRSVLHDYVHKASHQRVIDGGLLAIWALVTALGGLAIVGGVRMP